MFKDKSTQSKIEIKREVKYSFDLGFDLKKIKERFLLVSSFAYSVSGCLLTFLVTLFFIEAISHDYIDLRQLHTINFFLLIFSIVWKFFKGVQDVN